MPRALISVSDKRGIVDFATALVELGWDLVSPGGPAGVLRKAGIPVSSVDQVTGFPEIEGKASAGAPSGAGHDADDVLQA